MGRNPSFVVSREVIVLLEAGGFKLERFQLVCAYPQCWK